MGRINRERGETILGRKREKIWKGLKGKGGKDLNGERGPSLRRNREKISARGKALGRKGGKGSQQGKGGKDLSEEREKLPGREKGAKDLSEEKGEDLKRPSGEEGERSSTGKGGRRS